MIVTMLDIDPQEKSILFVVLERPNIERMKVGDPVTLESPLAGGILPAPKYPQDFSLCIAYEPDHDELYKMCAKGGKEFLMWLERGRVFIPGVDGPGKAFKVPSIRKMQESNNGE
jgi:hypothetical protein